MQQSLIIQCSNLFEYKHLVDNFVSNILIYDMYRQPTNNNKNIQLFDRTYTIRMTDHSIFDSLINQIIEHAPTCKITRKVFNKHKAAYIKIKE